jgi:biofilm protein TabA
MIFDRLENFRIYLTVNPHFAVVLDFLEKRLSTLATNQKYSLDGNAYALASEYQSKPFSECFIECHRKFIDIQIVIQGIEKIGVCNISACKEISAYDEEKDFQKLEGDLNFIILKPGYFAVFFPQDGHMPGLQVSDTPTLVKKIVLKIPATI